MPFQFATAGRIIFGPGTFSQAGDLAAEYGISALVVTGKDARRADPLLELLKKSGVAASVFSVTGEPDLETVRRGVAQARAASATVIVGMGGGSAIDTGKAIAALLANPGDILDYVEVIGQGQVLTKPSLPYLAIPTTAGTGSEVTRNAVLASPEHKVKVSLRSHLMLPAVALVDPELTRDLPPFVTATTGLDALTQLMEAYVCNRANALTDPLCEEGLHFVGRSLRVAFSDGSAVRARENMAAASLLSGLALSNAGLGAVHGLAGPIGGMFPAPHGAICAALLPHVMEANIAALRHKADPALERYEIVAHLLTKRASASADSGVEWVRQLVAEMEIPGLASYGVKAADFAAIVQKSTQASSMKANPVALSAAELTSVIRAALQPVTAPET